MILSSSKSTITHHRNFNFESIVEIFVRFVSNILSKFDFCNFEKRVMVDEFNIKLREIAESFVSLNSSFTSVTYTFWTTPRGRHV